LLDVDTGDININLDYDGCNLGVILRLSLAR